MMNAFRNFIAGQTNVVCLLGLFLLSGCGPLGGLNVFSKSDDDDEKLSGKRESVMFLEDQLIVDADSQQIEIALPMPYENTDWSQPGGHTANAMHHLKLPRSLKRVWSSRAGEGSDDRARILASPIVADGKVFVRDAHAGVLAFDQQSGRRLWEIDMTPKEKRVKSYHGTGGGIAFAPGLLVATNGFGFVVGLDPQTGRELWRRDLEFDIRSAPAIYDGRVFVTTFDNQLHALDASSGEILWSHRSFEEVARILVSSSPAIENDIVIAPYSSGEIYAIDAKTGREAWSDSLSRTGRLTPLSAINDIAGRPVLDRGIVFAISHAGRLAAIDARLGQRIWTHNIGGTQTPWIAGDYLYVLTDNSELVCFQRETGKTLWITQLRAFKDEEKRKKTITWSGPVLGSDRLIVLSSEGDAISISPYTGEKLGRIEMPSGALIAPVISNQMVFVLTDEAQLVAYR